MESIYTITEEACIIAQPLPISENHASHQPVLISEWGLLSGSIPALLQSQPCFCTIAKLESLDWKFIILWRTECRRDRTHHGDLL